jgi:hypothetical protein
MAFVISGRLRIRIGDDAETTAKPGAIVFVPPGVARRFTADLDDTRVYHGFIPAGFEQLLVGHAARTESMAVLISEAPFDPQTATVFGIDVVPE